MGHRRDYQRQSEVAAFEGDQDDGAKDNKIMRQLSLRNLQHELQVFMSFCCFSLLFEIYLNFLNFLF